jgi:hypothetical protein
VNDNAMPFTAGIAAAPAAELIVAPMAAASFSFMAAAAVMLWSVPRAIIAISTAGLNGRAEGVDRRYGMAGSQRDDLIVLICKVFPDHESADLLPGKHCEGGFDFARRACIEDHQLHSKRPCRTLRIPFFGFGYRSSRFDEKTD